MHSERLSSSSGSSGAHRRDHAPGGPGTLSPSGGGFDPLWGLGESHLHAGHHRGAAAAAAAAEGGLTRSKLNQVYVLLATAYMKKQKHGKAAHLLRIMEELNGVSSAASAAAVAGHPLPSSWGLLTGDSGLESRRGRGGGDDGFLQGGSMAGGAGGHHAPSASMSMMPGMAASRTGTGREAKRGRSSGRAGESGSMVLSASPPTAGTAAGSLLLASPASALSSGSGGGGGGSAGSGA